jgi:dolichyl-phosphate beta-glucosyltransferase
VTVSLVVPCYNEAARLRPEAFSRAAEANEALRIVVVDDGSRDATRAVLDRMAAEHPGRIVSHGLAVNSGKAEAVRQGMLRALEDRPDYVGYWDADLATPFEALPDFTCVFARNPSLDIVIGSRVQMLGRKIERSPFRHYTGRVFATSASLVLRLPVYDTQCGAKLFRRTPRLSRMLATPFKSRWIFDVELLARYLDDRGADGQEPPPSADRIYEVALRTWVDEPGSKVRAKDGIRAFSDLVRIYRARP